MSKYQSVLFLYTGKIPLPSSRDNHVFNSCSMLPDTLLTCHVYAQFISLYRQLLTEAVMDEWRDSQDAGYYLVTYYISSYTSISIKANNCLGTDH